MAGVASVFAGELKGDYETIIEDVWVTHPGENVEIYTRVLRPDPAGYPGEAFPAVIMVAGGTGAGAPALDRSKYRDLASQGLVVVAFNLPGRGTGQPGNLTSGGEEDFNGFAGQDALKAVIDFVIDIDGVDRGNLGVLTNSYGIAVGAGTVGRYPDLPVAWLVDMEGPSDSLIVACYYCDREFGMGGHMSTTTDPSPENVAWWDEREAYRFIGDFRGEYLRVQAWHDHVQPEGLHLHALQMNDAALNGGVAWVRLNGSDMGNAANQFYEDGEVAWLPGRMADYRDLDVSYILEMARRSGSFIDGWWNSRLSMPHDVDRLADGRTLITTGRDPSTVMEVDDDGRCVGLYRGTLDFAHNADQIFGGHTIVSDTGNDRVVELDADNLTVWSSEWVSISDGSHLDYPNDVNVVDGDRLLVTDRDNNRVIEIERDGQLVWQFGETGVAGADSTHLSHPHNADRLANGNTLIADSDNNRIVEVTPSGSLAWVWQPADDDALDWPRDADRLANGHTLVTDSRNGRVVEVDASGTILWQHVADLALPYDADRLSNGNTLIADSMHDRVIEVDPEGVVVWRYPAVVSTDRSSVFGFHPAGVFAPGYPDNGFSDAENIGVRWHRPPVYAFWFLVQPDMGSNSFDFTLLDRQYGDVPSGISILANIAPETPLRPGGRTVAGTYLPVDETAYRAFVRATIERFDGDGVNDMPGLVNPIHHWQVGNEPRLELSNFADLQRMTYEEIKEACPQCTVLIAGVAGFPEGYVGGFDRVYGPILSELAGTSVDVFDFHWYGNAFGDYRFRDTATGQDALEHIRTTLVAHGFSPDLPLWITEMGTYSGHPAGPQFGFQSERDQARDLFKRLVYPLSRGIEKVFPAFGLIEGFKHDGGYFDHTGLMYDGQGAGDLGLGVKKLGYYTYKKMTELLEGADWTTLETLEDGSSGLFAFRVWKDGRLLHMAWWDNFNGAGGGGVPTLRLEGLGSRSVRVSSMVPLASVGADVAGFEEAFAVSSVPVFGGRVSIRVDEDPVVIEELGDSPPRRPSGRATAAPSR